MKKKMIIEALLHTLLPTYGNENVYHPDGSAIPVADLVARFCQPDNPPAALTIRVYSSHGHFLVDRSTGDVTDRNLDEDTPDDYWLVYWFDLDEYFRWRTSQNRATCEGIDICGITSRRGSRGGGILFDEEPFEQGWRDDVERMKSKTETFGKPIQNSERK